MTVSFGIDAETGALLLGDVRLSPQQDREEAVSAMQGLSPQFLFGHLRMAVLPVTFGERPSVLGLEFRNDQLAGADLTIGSDFAIGPEAEKQVGFVCDILSREYGIHIRDAVAKFPWGAVYSYVTRGHAAAHGVRFGPGGYMEVIDKL